LHRGAIKKRGVTTKRCKRKFRPRLGTTEYNIYNPNSKEEKSEGKKKQAQQLSKGNRRTERAKNGVDQNGVRKKQKTKHEGVGAKVPPIGGRGKHNKLVGNRPAST